LADRTNGDSNSHAEDPPRPDVSIPPAADVPPRLWTFLAAVTALIATLMSIPAAATTFTPESGSVDWKGPSGWQKTLWVIAFCLGTLSMCFRRHFIEGRARAWLANRTDTCERRHHHCPHRFSRLGMAELRPGRQRLVSKHDASDTKTAYMRQWPLTGCGQSDRGTVRRRRLPAVRPDELERRLRERLDALGPAPRAELLHVLMLPFLWIG
jgi:hypothetical protein